MGVSKINLKQNMETIYVRKSSSQEKKLKNNRDAKVKASTEPGFDIENCMADFKIHTDQTFEHDTDYYFDSYAHFGIHEEMLKDKTRTLAYRDAIMNSPNLFKDKIVLDIGCGTGILSIFAAKAGARHVYGIENASIATHAAKIVKENGLGEKITIIKGKVEEVQLPVDKVDIIISEWMGYFLLYEAMLDTVLFARDKWLKADGLMFPDRAVMYLAAIEDADYKEQKIGFWDNVYGVNMSSIKAWALLEPLVDVVDKDLLNTDYCPILDIDLKTVTVPQLDFSSEYNVQFRRNDKVHGLAVWFDVFFSFSTPSVKLSTSPYNRETHWKQTVFYLNDVLTVKKGDTMSGSIAAKKSKSNPRELDIKISYHIDNESQKLNASQFYRLC